MLLATLIAGTLVVSPLAFSGEVEISGEAITLGAIADLKDLPAELRARAEVLVLYPIPPSKHATVIEQSKLASRARSLLPALSPWLTGKFEGKVKIGNASQSPPVLTAFCGEGIPKGALVPSVLNAGWYRIERKMEAIQQGEQGMPFFVRTSDGDVTTVYCEEGS